MEITTISAQRREERGRNQVASLRKRGYVPAVLYGGGGETVRLSLPEHELVQQMRHHHKVLRLELEGAEQSSLVQDVQWDCLTDRLIHVDFLRIDLSKEIHVTVELAFLGHPKGLGKGGRLIHDLNDLTVRCLPGRIPEVIEVQVGELDVGDHVLAGEVALPGGVVLDVPEDTVVCHVLGQAAELLHEAGEAGGAEPSKEGGEA